MAENKIDNDKLIEMVQKEGRTLTEAAAFFKCSVAAVSKRMRRLTATVRVEDIIERHGLTDKQARFCLEKAQGSTATNAALAAYECRSLDSAKNIGSDLMQKPAIQTAITELMEAEGLTRQYRVRKLKAHVDSKAPDVSLRALDMSFKLADEYPATRNIHLNMNVELTAEQIAEFQKRYGD